MRHLAVAAFLLAGPAAAQTLVIGNKGEDTVSFVDLKSGREVARRPTGPQPHEVAISPDGKRAAVVAYGGNTIDVFDVASARKLETIDLGTNRRPHGLIWLRDGRLVATTEGSDTLTIAKPSRGGWRVRGIATGQQGTHMVSASTRTALVTNMRSGSVSRIDINNSVPVRSYPAGAEPEGLALSPTNQLWVADRKGDTVRVLDPLTGAQVVSFPTGKTPIRIVIPRDGQYAYVSNFGAGTISVYDARELRPAGTITVSGRADAMQVTLLLSPDERRLYAAETGTDTIAEVDLRSRRVLRRLPAGKMGDGLGIARIDVKR